VDLTKDKLKNTPWFHTVDPVLLEGIEEWTLWLEALLHNPCSIWEENGEFFLIENKQLVERHGGLKIEIYPNEHPPPHFHVKSPDVNASFTIADCRLLQGHASDNDLRKIRFWHNRSKPKLIECWNSTRPTHSLVGKYTGSD
jgi:Domain of unknown function (DUF4160)